MDDIVQSILFETFSLQLNVLLHWEDCHGCDVTLVTSTHLQQDDIVLAPGEVPADGRHPLLLVVSTQPGRHGGGCGGRDG